MRSSARARNRAIRKRISILVSVVLVAVAIAFIISSSNSRQNNQVSVGEAAPNIPVYLTNGTTISLNKLLGHEVLLWFVTTWCSSCQVGAQMIAKSYYSSLASKGIVILTVESYNNLGVAGPSMAEFQAQYAGGSRQGWLFGTTTLQATQTYNPDSFLDIYYLISPEGRVIASGANLPASIRDVLSSV